MEILALIGAVLPLLVMIMKEFFSARARARAKNEKWELDDKMAWQLVESAVLKMRERARRENGEVGPVEDEVDRQKKGESLPPDFG